MKYTITEAKALDAIKLLKKEHDYAIRDLLCDYMESIIHLSTIGEIGIGDFADALKKAKSIADLSCIVWEGGQNVDKEILQELLELNNN